MKITWNYFTVYDEVLIIHNARETLHVNACMHARLKLHGVVLHTIHFIIYTYIEMDYVHRSNL